MEHLQGYESWRISYQDSEQAARAAYKQWKQWHNESQKQDDRIHELTKALIEVLRNGWPWESYNQQSKLLDLPEEMFGLPPAMIRARDALGEPEFLSAVLPHNDRTVGPDAGLSRQVTHE